MLCEVRIDNQDQEASVEELGHKHFVCDGGLLLAIGIFSNPNHKLNYYNLQYYIDPNNNKCNRLPHHLRQQDILVVLLTNSSLIDQIPLQPKQLIHSLA